MQKVGLTQPQLQAGGAERQQAVSWGCGQILSRRPLWERLKVGRLPGLSKSVCHYLRPHPQPTAAPQHQSTLSAED